MRCFGRARDLPAAALLAASGLLCPALARAATVTGTVFADLNGNGLQDPGEPGIAGALVSDGIQLVAADASGQYTLATTAPLLWVRVPAGYAPGIGFWASLARAPAIADFPLEPDPATSGSTITFAQISDVHLNYNDMLAKSVVTKDDLARLFARLVVDGAAPAFVVATGDLTQDSLASSFDAYEAAIQTQRLPVANVAGNHDWYDGGAEYRAHFGPPIYSFDAGPCHFIVTNTNLAGADAAGVSTWATTTATLLDTERAAGTLPAGEPVVVALHAPPEDVDVEYLATHGVRFILSGHWHASRVFDVGDVVHVNSPPAVFGGIDLSPGGYRIITLSATGGMPSIQTAYRPIPLAPALTPAFPADGSTIPPSTITALASAMGFVEAADVAATLDGAPLSASSARGGYSVGVDGVALTSPGKHTIVWTVVPKGGGAPLATASATFAVATPSDVPPVPGSDWPAFHAGPEHAGSAADALVPPLSLAWAAPTGGYINMASPVVKDGLVFQTMLDFDGGQGMGQSSGLVALDGATGKRIWSFATGSPAESSAAVAGDVVLVTTQDGTVYALDEATGALRWKSVLTPPAASMRSRDDVWMYAGPVVDGSTVFVGATPDFYALDLTTGAPLWQVETQWQWLMSYSTPAIASGVVLAVFGRGLGPDSLAAYDEKSGAVRWTTGFDTGGMEASPAVSNGTAYVASGTGTLAALRTADGSTAWSASLVSGNIWSYDLVSTPTVGPDAIYVATATGVVQAVDRSSGNLRWMFMEGSGDEADVSPFKSVTRTITSSPALSGEVLYVGGNDGILYALAVHDGNAACPGGTSAKAGCLLWTAALGAPTASSPAISGDFLYVGTLAGMVYAFAGPSSPIVNPSATTPANGCACSALGGPMGRPSHRSILLATLLTLLALAGAARLALGRRPRSAQSSAGSDPPA